MKQLLFCLMVCMTEMSGMAQSSEKIQLTAVSASEYTGQDFTPWLNEDVNNLINNVWLQTNFKYIDVTVSLEKKTKITSLSLYDFEGTFQDKPASFYAKNGAQQTLIGTFTGDRYKEWVQLIPSQPLDADAIVVHKYGNNIPQKIIVYGTPTNSVTTATKVTTISFPDIPRKKKSDASFPLTISSNNAETDIEVSSSNSSVVSVAKSENIWMGTILSAGTALLTARQTGSTGFEPAAPVSKTVIVEADSIVAAPVTPTPVTGVQRIRIVSITPTVQTGQDYSSWLSDDLEYLVPKSWDPRNNQVVEIKLQLETKASIHKLSFFDDEGIFTDQPALIFALNGTEKTYLGKFEGLTYKKFVDLTLDDPVTADALVIQKWRNNIPQKIFVYGYPSTAAPSSNPITPVPTVLTFFNLPDKNVSDRAFVLNASSNNTETPIVFTSSNNNIVSVSNLTGQWIATIKNPGTAIITASQEGNERYTTAKAVSQTQLIKTTANTTTSGKILIQPKRWYQLTNTTNGLGGLFDGNLTQKVETGWGKVLNNYDSYYPLAEGEEWTIEQIKFYDGEGSNENEPVTVSVITGTGEIIVIGRFIGNQYNTWVGPDPSHPTQFTLPLTIPNIKYLVLNSWNSFPTEMELYGSFKAGKTESVASQKHLPLKNVFGVNAFEWDFEHPNHPSIIDDERMNVIKNFTGVRHYLDWERLEYKEGHYTFNPAHLGGWNYDAIYERCKQEGIQVLACLKTIPNWLQETYPVNERDNENIPMRYGSDPANPKSYIEQGRLAFQFAARYGKNSNVPYVLLSVDASPRWSGDQVNSIKTGMDLIEFIECENERDKWWKARKAYQTAYEYAANLSAFYDGHKGALGLGVGVKNADPQMKVVMGGLAAANTEYVRGMIEWCRQNRGYRQDGTIDVCWDIINYHLYSNDAKTSQAGNATRGAAPEVSEATQVAKDFLQLPVEYKLNMPVWITETGYDVNQGSPFKAIPIADKSFLHTQADWILRTALLYNRLGIDRVFFYQLYDDNPTSSIQFGSSGLMNANRSRKPAADFLYQAQKLLGSYVFQQTLNNYPLVDRYEWKGQQAYTLLIPDEKGASATYELELLNAAAVRIYTPAIGSDTMNVRWMPVTNGKVSLTVTETPIFVFPESNDPLKVMGLSKESVIENISIESGLPTIDVFPNPAISNVTIQLKNFVKSKVEIRIVEAANGKILKTYQYPAPEMVKDVNIVFLSQGYYLIEVKQGAIKKGKMLYKAN